MNHEHVTSLFAVYTLLFESVALHIIIKNGLRGVVSGFAFGRPRFAPVPVRCATPPSRGPERVPGRVRRRCAPGAAPGRAPAAARPSRCPYSNIHSARPAPSHGGRAPGGDTLTPRRCSASPSARTTYSAQPVLNQEAYMRSSARQRPDIHLSLIHI